MKDDKRDIQLFLNFFLKVKVFASHLFSFKLPHNVFNDPFYVTSTCSMLFITLCIFLKGNIAQSKTFHAFKEFSFKKKNDFLGNIEYSCHCTTCYRIYYCFSLKCQLSLFQFMVFGAKFKFLNANSNFVPK